MNEVIRRIRRNHALEHATVALLLDKGVLPPLGGYSTPGGFFIFGRVSNDLVMQSAGEALDKLNHGMKELAISPYCGTNLATGVLLGGILANIIMGRKRKGRLLRLPLAVAAFVGMAFLGRPLGNVLQRAYTTLSETESMEIVGVSRVPFVPFTIYRVKTIS